MCMIEPPNQSNIKQSLISSGSVGDIGDFRSRWPAVERNCAAAFWDDSQSPDAHLLRREPGRSRGYAVTLVIYVKKDVA